MSTLSRFTFLSRCLHPKAVLVAFGLLACFSRPASTTPVRWTLKDVTFGTCQSQIYNADLSLVNGGVCVDGGAAAGYFIVDPVTAEVVDWSITVSGGDTSLFPVGAYTPANSASYLSGLNWIGFNRAGTNRWLVFELDGFPFWVNWTGSPVAMKPLTSSESTDLEPFIYVDPSTSDSFLFHQWAIRAMSGVITAAVVDPPEPVAKVIEVLGDVTIKHADGTDTRAEVGSLLFFGDVIETSARGAVNLLFADNTTFAITENARFRIDESVYDPSVKPGSFFSWLQGVFVYTSGLIGKDNPDVNIQTPIGGIGIRGDAADIICSNLANTDHPCDVSVQMRDVASPVSLVAPVASPTEPALLLFTYAFLDPVGTFQVSLNDQLLFSTAAWEHPLNQFQHATINVPVGVGPQNAIPVSAYSDPAQPFSKTLLLVPAAGGTKLSKLTFRFEGQQTGSRFLIDDIVFPGLQNGDFSHGDEGWFWIGPSRLEPVLTFTDAHFAEFLHLIDSIPPSTTAVVSPAANAGGWNRTDVVVTLSAVDNVDGLGVQAISVLSSGTATGADTVDGPSAALNVSAEGLTAIEYFARDKAGNQETTHSLVVRVDKTAPSITPPADQSVDQTMAGGANASYSAPTIVETGSGLASSSCSPTSGSLFRLGVTTVSCSATDVAGNTGFASFTVTVKPTPTSTPDGRIYGAGHLAVGGQHHHFVLRASQSRGHDSGDLEYWVSDARGEKSGHDYDHDRDFDGDHDRNYGRDHRDLQGQFDATSITQVTLSDDPAFRPGRSGPQPMVDSVRFTGAGKWNGRPGYTFEATATDRGEPGKGRDTVSLIVRDSTGKTVVNISGTIEGGNIQSTRLTSRRD